MGPPDWAAKMVTEFHEEFDVCPERTLRITSLVRGFVSDGVFGDHGSKRWERQHELFVQDLVETLRDQPGDTIEEKWNNLITEQGIQNRTEQPVFLEPWAEVEQHDPDDPVRYADGYSTEQ